MPQQDPLLGTPLSLNELINESHQTAIDKGWWEGGIEKRSIGDIFSNFHAELSEAWEEYRRHGMIEGSMIYFPRPVAATSDELAKPEGLAVELADLLIRVFDFCGAYDIPLYRALLLKLTYNRTRPYRHGGKQA